MVAYIDTVIRRDEKGRVVSRTEAQNGVKILFMYHYDRDGRLVRVTQRGRLGESYVYDSEGRRTQDTVIKRGILQRTYTYEGMKLQKAGAQRFIYDEQGRLVVRSCGGEQWFYSYDDAGRLRAVELPGLSRLMYEYDRTGRRVAKKLDGARLETYGWNDCSKLSMFLDHVRDILIYFEYPEDAATPGFMVMSGKRYSMEYDYALSLRCVRTPCGRLIKEIVYDSFGNVLSDSNPGLRIPLGFAGGLHDRDTGLVRFGVRDYDPNVGRWTAPEPHGLLERDADLYDYCIDDPVNHRDPSGLQTYPIEGYCTTERKLVTPWMLESAHVAKARGERNKLYCNWVRNVSTKTRTYATTERYAGKSCPSSVSESDFAREDTLLSKTERKSIGPIEISYWRGGERIQRAENSCFKVRGAQPRDGEVSGRN